MPDSGIQFASYMKYSLYVQTKVSKSRIGKVIKERKEDITYWTNSIQIDCTIALTGIKQKITILQIGWACKAYSNITKTKCTQRLISCTSQMLCKINESVISESTQGG